MSTTILFCLWISLFNVSPANQIVCAGIINIGDCAEYFRRNAAYAELVAGICPAVDKQLISDLLLCKVGIFPLVLYTIIFHILHPSILYHGSICTIDIWLKMWHNLLWLG